MPVPLVSEAPKVVTDPTSTAVLEPKDGFIPVTNASEKPTSPINLTPLPPDEEADPSGGVDTTVHVSSNSESTIPVSATTNTEETLSKVSTVTPPAPESKGTIFARYVAAGAGILTVIGAGVGVGVGELVGGVVGGTVGLVVGLVAALASSLYYA